MATTTGYIDYTEQGSTPTTPATTHWRLYFKSDGLYYVDDTGTASGPLPASALSNPMTTSGDIIYGGASGVPTRLAKGSDGQVLKLASGVPSWAVESGGGATPYVSTLQAFPTGLGATNALTANRIYVAKFTPGKDITVSTAYWYCVTSSGNLDIGIYDAALTTKLGSTGSFASPGTGNQSHALTGSVSLTAGTSYYLALEADNATIKIAYTSPTNFYSGQNLYGIQSAAAFPLPASVTATFEGAGGYAFPMFSFA